MFYKYRNKFLTIGVLWGLFSGIESLLPSNPLSWPKLAGERLFSLLELTALPPSVFYLAGVSLWSALFWIFGEIIDRSIMKRRAVRSLSRIHSHKVPATHVNEGSMESSAKEPVKQNRVERGL